MIDVAIPGFGRIELSDLVCDYNGTLAADGVLLSGIRERVSRLSGRMRVHVVTGDTFGTARSQLADLGCALVILPESDQAEAKRVFVDGLGPQRVVAVGNGRNDRLMLASAALGIGVCGDEGIAGEALRSCTIVVRHIHDALDLLLSEKRLMATLRG
jgi:soluble P-type ATPase